MAVDNSRRPAYDLHDHPSSNGPRSRLQQQNPSRAEPDDGDASPPDVSRTGIDDRDRRSVAPAAAVTRSRSYDGNTGTVAATATAGAGDVRRPYDSDLETESAYQQATWDRIQRWRREIMQMRTPKRDGITPARSYKDIHRRQLQGPVAADDGARGNQGLPLTARSGLRDGGMPTNYVNINRRQVAQPNYNRRSVVHPSKTYSEIFAKKKENETTYTNVAKKNVFGGVSTFLPFKSRCSRCGSDLRKCTCHQQHPTLPPHALLPIEGAGQDWMLRPELLSHQLPPPHHPLHMASVPVLTPNYFVNWPPPPAPPHPRAPTLGRDALMPLPMIADGRHDRQPYSRGGHHDLLVDIGRPSPGSGVENGYLPNRAMPGGPQRHPPDGFVWLPMAFQGDGRRPIPPIEYNNNDARYYRHLDEDQQVNLELNVNLVDDGDPMRTILLNRNDVRDVVAVRRDVEQDGSRHGGLQMPPHRANGDERRWTSELSSNGYSDPPAHWRQLVNT